MINDQEAADYAQQMHPAFAGYLFDGKVSTYDALAVIFHLLKKGVLEPEFKDKHILHGIEYIRLMHQKPEFEFEQIICNTMFQNSTRLSAKEIGEYIKSNTIQDIILKNTFIISKFPIIANKLKFEWQNTPIFFSVNGENVDTIEKANEFKKILYRVIIPIFVLLIPLVGLIYFLLPKNSYIGSNGEQVTDTYIMGTTLHGSGSPLALYLIAIIFPFIAILFWYLFNKSVKKIEYQFAEQIVPFVREKYKELFNFLTTFPPKEHNYTYGFLPFAIAFGITDSWHGDFGLEKEIKIDKSTMTE